MSKIGDIRIFDLDKKRINRSKKFRDIELGMLNLFISGLEDCDVSDNLEFSNYMMAASNYFTLQMSRKGISRKMGITTMTLQRWSKGRHLPYAEPRRAFICELTDMFKERRSTLTSVASFARQGNTT